VASPFVLDYSGLPSSTKSGRDPYIPCDRHQKVLFSNLGLTVFVRHLVDLVKQVPIVCPQGRKECFTLKLPKEIETTVVSIFVHYHQQKKNAIRCSFSFHRAYICLMVYIAGQNSASSKVPLHTSIRDLLLFKKALLVAVNESPSLTELFLNY
jgi:hypothetical protein